MPVFKDSLYHILPLRNPILFPKYRADIMSFLLWKELRTYLCTAIIWPFKTQYLHVFPSFLTDVLLESFFPLFFIVPMIVTLKIFVLRNKTHFTCIILINGRMSKSFMTESRISRYASFYNNLCTNPSTFFLKKGLIKGYAPICLKLSASSAYMRLVNQTTQSATI